MKKILVCASTNVHIENFHLKYIDALKQKYTVKTMATGHDFQGRYPDFDVNFKKNIFSLSNFKSVFIIKKILKQEKFDVVFLNTSLASFFVRLAIKLMKKSERPKVVNIVHGYLFDKHTPVCKRLLLLGAEKFVKNVTDEIVVMNKEDEIIAKRNHLYKNHLYFIDGMGVEDFDKNKYEKTSKDETIFCFVGELSKRKNQKFLIKFISKLNKKGRNSKLILLGYGDQTEKLKKYARHLNIEEKIIFVGYDKDISKSVIQADYYISASKIEGLPFNIVEAMRLQKVVISADVKGCNDVIKDGENGILYKPFSQKDLMRKFEYIDSNLVLKNNIGAKARKTSDKYLLKNIFDKNLSLFESFINKNE